MTLSLPDDYTDTSRAASKHVWQIYTTFTLAHFCGPAGQPSLFDSVNSNKTELKWAGTNQASMHGLAHFCSVNVVLDRRELNL